MNVYVSQNCIPCVTFDAEHIPTWYEILTATGYPLLVRGYFARHGTVILRFIVTASAPRVYTPYAVSRVRI